MSFKYKKTFCQIVNISKKISDRRYVFLYDLKGNFNDDQIVEFVISAIIRQMADTGLAIVLLTTSKKKYFPLQAASLCRQIFEGYVYLNYIFADDSPWRGKEFSAHDLLRRESFIERSKGQNWHRRYKQKQKVTTPFFNISIDQTLIDDCDEFEKEWLLHSIRHINSLLTENSRFNYAQIESESLTQMRQEWFSCKARLQNPILREWQLLTDRWDNMDKWPFGLSPSRLLDAYGLSEFLPDEESIPGITQLELETLLKQKQDIEQQSYWVGWDLLSNYVHFSPALLNPISDDSLSIFYGHISVFLLSALDFTNTRFNWIQKDKIKKLGNLLKKGS